jgi:CelD/BcsL family acetyltransferase involved in cellulose biosynthesis
LLRRRCFRNALLATAEGRTFLDYTGKIPVSFPATLPSSSQLKNITANKMQIEIIRDAASWAAMAEEWNALLEESHQRVPFLTYEFQRAWWDHLGGGEWKDAQLHILTAREEEGRLVGVAPLFRVEDQQGQGTMHFIGTHEIADFLDFIVRPKDHVSFLQAVIEHLSAEEDWQLLDLYNLLDTSQTSEVLSSLTVEKPWDFKVETLQPSPYIPIPSTFDAYEASLDSKQAHELRRKLRRAAKNPETISVEVVTDKDQLPAALDDFFALMRQEVDKDHFLSPQMHAQMAAIAQAASDGGWLQLFFLKAGNKRIAGYMNFDYDACIWAYNAGFNNSYAELSPGWLIMGEMMRWTIEHGRKIFDFMRGDEEYKYRFGGTDRFVQRVTITRLP